MRNNFRKLTAGMALVLFICAGCAGKEQIQDMAEDFLDTEWISLTEDNFADTTELCAEYAEEKEYPRLAAFLADYYQIPEEEWKKTRYYYDYFDLNGDGKDEIIAAVISDTLPDSNGDPVLFLEEEKESFAVLDAFEHVHTPITICESMTNGWHDIILDVYGIGVEEGYLMHLHGVEGGYQDGSSELFDEMPQDINGWQILSNNLIDDMDRGEYLTIGPRDE